MKNSKVRKEKYVKVVWRVNNPQHKEKWLFNQEKEIKELWSPEG